MGFQVDYYERATSWHSFDQSTFLLIRKRPIQPKEKYQERVSISRRYGSQCEKYHKDYLKRLRRYSKEFRRPL